MAKKSSPSKKQSQAQQRAEVSSTPPPPPSTGSAPVEQKGPFQAVHPRERLMNAAVHSHPPLPYYGPPIPAFHPYAYGLPVQYSYHPYLPTHTMVEPTLAHPPPHVSVFNQYPVTIDQLVRLRRQIEYYFSFENLVKDEYLLKQLEANKGLVPCHVVANFHRMVSIMNGVQPSCQMITLALLPSTQVRVLYGQYLVPITDVVIRVLKHRAALRDGGSSNHSSSSLSALQIKHGSTTDGTTSATDSLSSSATPENEKDHTQEVSDYLKEDSERPPVSGVPQGDKNVVKEKTISTFDSTSEDINQAEYLTIPSPPNMKVTFQEEHKTEWEEDNSNLLKGMLGLNLQTAKLQGVK